MDTNSEVTNLTAKEIYESDELTKEEKIVAQVEVRETYKIEPSGNPKIPGAIEC